MTNYRGFCGVCLGLLLCGGVLVSCGRAEVRTSPQPTKEQVQQDSDRFFENMRQEERDQSSSK